MKKTHIIWDWNGTLLDDTWLCIEVMNELLTRRGLPELTLNDYLDKFDFPVSRYYRRIGITGENAEFEKASVEFIGSYEKRRLNCRLFPDVDRILNQLREDGYAMSVLSAYKQNTLIEILEHFELCRLFDIISGQSDIYARGKSANGKRLIETWGCDPRNTVLIGDTIHDYEVACEMGIDCILIAGGHQSLSRISRTEALIVEGLREIPDFL